MTSKRWILQHWLRCSIECKQMLFHPTPSDIYLNYSGIRPFLPPWGSLPQLAPRTFVKARCEITRNSFYVALIDMNHVFPLHWSHRSSLQQYRNCSIFYLLEDSITDRATQRPTIQIPHFLWLNSGNWSFRRAVEPVKLNTALRRQAWDSFLYRAPINHKILMISIG